MKHLLIALIIVTIPTVTFCEWQAEVHGVSAPQSIASDSSGNRLIVSIYKAGGIWLSNDCGNTWEQINSHVDETPVLRSVSNCTFEAVGADADTLVISIIRRDAGVIPPAEYHSYDGGQTWGSFTQTITDCWPDTLDNVTIGYDPTYIYSDRIYYSRQSGFAISYDGGVDFQVVSLVHLDCGTEKALYDPFHPDTIYLHGSWTPNPFPPYGTLGGILASYDGGYHWQRSLLIEDMTDDETGTVADMTYGSDGGVYALIQWRPSLPYPPVLKYVDDDQNWIFTGEEGLPESIYLGQIQAIPEHPGRIFIGGVMECGVWESNDDGQTWHRLLRGLPEIPCGVNEFYRNPYSGHVYVLLMNNGIYRSTDYGDSWHLIPSPPIGNTSKGLNKLKTGEGGVIHGSMEAPLFFSTGDAISFGEIPMLGSDQYHGFRTWAVDYPSDTLIVNSTVINHDDGAYTSAIMLSTDNGVSWSSANTPFPYMEEVISVESDSGRVMVGRNPSPNSLQYSYDLGATWIFRQDPFNPRELFELHGDIYCQNRTPPFDLYRSRDVGVTWEALDFPDGSSAYGGFPTAIIGIDGGIYLRACNICWYMDSTGQWQERGEIWDWFSGSGIITWDIVATPADTFITAVSDYSHYLSISHDMGWTWEEQEVEMPGDLNGEVGEGIAYDRWRDRLWIDTGLGLAYLDDPTAAVGEDVWVFQPATYATLTAYPNPFNSATTVRYTLTRHSDVRVTVFDLLGREVAVLRDGMATAGEHELLFDASDLSSGTYFLKLNSDDQTLTRKLTLVK